MASTGEVGMGPIEQQRTIMTPVVGEQVKLAIFPNNRFVVGSNACLYEVGQSGRAQVCLPDLFKYFPGVVCSAGGGRV